MSKDSILEGSPMDLLNQFELILESDPLIDEVGFIHPSQFVNLTEEEGDSLTQGGAFSSKGGSFWNRDHKLGISTHVVLALYRAAKEAFMGAVRQYREMKEGVSCFESEVMKHSKALLLLSCDFGTAWNSRKLIVSQKQNMSMFIDELHLSALVLSFAHKSEQAWCHRRWVIKMIVGKCSNLQEIIRKESELVEKSAERSKMNYRAWNHRSWLVSYMTTKQVLYEFHKSRNWAGLHVADSSCFHYRTRLLLRILKDSCPKQEEECCDQKIEVYQILKDELQWNEELINRYVGREALWLYRRFVSSCWVRQFETECKDTTHYSEHKSSTNAHIDIFLENELQLLSSCSTIPDNDFEDFQAQAIYSSTYILWLSKQIPESKRNEVELLEKLRARKISSMLSTAYPEKSSLWSSLMC